MSTWHQERGGHSLPKLCHPTLWRSYNPKGHLGVMTFSTKEECLKYCEKTGDIPVAHTKSLVNNKHANKQQSQLIYRNKQSRL